jgi:hypothetical protein
MSYNLDHHRWIGVRINALGATFIAALATYLIYGSTAGAGNTGFRSTWQQNLACPYYGSSGFLRFKRTSMWIFDCDSDFYFLKVDVTSLERIQGYIDIEHEPKPIEVGKPPAA